VSFNDHEGGTKSYKYMREHEVEVASMDYVPLRREIAAEQGVPGGVTSVTMHDGSIVRVRKPHSEYSPTDRIAAYSHVKECIDRGEVATGLLYLDEKGTSEMHTLNKTVKTPLVDVRFSELCPGSEVLEGLMGEYR
jgi:2-oxoglutarate ferredoxin oxidoreductase subunit beta